MADKPTICNRALAAIGVTDRISSIDEGTPEADLCKLHYDEVLREVLRVYPWNFARTFKNLGGPVETDLPPHWSHAYQLPPDCLRVWRVYGASGSEVVEPGAWVRAGPRIFINEDGPVIEYIRDEPDAGLYDSLFVAAVVARLGAELALGLAESRTMAAEMLSIFERRLMEARSVDSAENAPERRRSGGWETAHLE
ncbi:phage connector family protein [Salidesulfovibrio brasiliensis]|uniref:hypothetical protein n=1 Tax=Salidesulfovibrio brasiliensis TaxID=221711 RepID=UPI0006D1D821|nr:hypothetical protein [Salidesulfovibrio brasiliensis]